MRARALALARAAGEYLFLLGQLAGPVLALSWTAETWLAAAHGWTVVVYVNVYGEGPAEILLAPATVLLTAYSGLVTLRRWWGRPP